MFQVFKQLWLSMMWNTDDAENTFSDLIIIIIITNDFLFNITCAVYILSQMSTCLGFRHRKFAFFVYIITFTVYSLEFWVESNRSGETSRPTKPLTLTLDSGTQFSPQECMCVMFSFFVFSSLFFWGGGIDFIRIFPDQNCNRGMDKRGIRGERIFSEYFMKFANMVQTEKRGYAKLIQLTNSRRLF